MKKSKVTCANPLCRRRWNIAPLSYESKLLRQRIPEGTSHRLYFCPSIDQADRALDDLDARFDKLVTKDPSQRAWFEARFQRATEAVDSAKLDKEASCMVKFDSCREQLEEAFKLIEKQERFLDRLRGGPTEHAIHMQMLHSGKAPEDSDRFLQVREDILREHMPFNLRADLDYNPIVQFALHLWYNGRPTNMANPFGSFAWWARQTEA